MKYTIERSFLGVDIGGIRTRVLRTHPTLTQRVNALEVAVADGTVPRAMAPAGRKSWWRWLARSQSREPVRRSPAGQRLARSQSREPVRRSPAGQRRIGRAHAPARPH